jgi:hypothetical protein
MYCHLSQAIQHWKLSARLQAKIFAAARKLSTQQQPLLSKLQTSQILVVVAADGEYVKQFNTL